MDQQVPQLTPTQPQTQDSPVGIDPAIVGQKVKATWKNGVAADGRPYASIPDGEIGSMYMLKHGNQGIAALGIDPTTYRQQQNQKMKDQQAKTQEYGTIKTSIENTLDSYAKTPRFEKNMVAAASINNLPFTPAANYNKQTEGAAAGITKALSNSQRFPTNTEVNKLVGLLPSLAGGDSNASDNVAKLNNLLEVKYGEGLDPEYLQQFGLKVNSKGKTVSVINTTANSNKLPPTPTTPSQNSIGQNAENELKNGINGVLNIPANIVNAGKADVKTLTSKNATLQQKENVINSLDPSTMLKNTAINVGKTFISNANKDLGEPLQGGDILGRMGQNLHDRPLGTAVDVATVALPAARVAFGAKVADAADLAETPGATPAESTVAAKAAIPATQGVNPIQKVVTPIVNNAKTAVKYLTTNKAKTVQQMQQAVNDGGSLDWGTIVNNARDEIANKGVPAKKALDNLINQETPAQLGNPQLTSDEGFELRKGLGARLPSNVFERALTKSSTGNHVAENQAIEALRRSVSNELKAAAPNITEPDQMYTLIKKLHGDAPTWAKRLIAIEAAKHLGENIPFLGPLLKEVPLP